MATIVHWKWWSCSGMSTPQRTITMSAHRKRKSNGRNERHGAAWGGVRLLLLALILVANQSFAQNVRAVLDNDGSSVNGKLAPDLARVLQGSSSRSMRVIVQYNQAP